MIYDWLTCLHVKLCYQKALKMNEPFEADAS